jgi:putative copper resistance protein D
MPPLVIAAARFLQFVCALALMGCPAFFVYILPSEGLGAASGLRWPRLLLRVAAIGLALGAAVQLSAQTAVMTDTPADAFHPAAIAGVITDTQFGRITALRAGLALAAGLLLLIGRPSRPLWLGVAVLGAAMVASFAWTGHGSADEGLAGALHMAADVLHLMAAAVWIGALIALSALLLGAKGLGAEGLPALHGALKGFSGIGSAVVAVILATGLINSGFLVGPAHLTGLVTTAYGLMLTAKVVLFLLMLGLAAANRFQLTPRLEAALGGPADGALDALRRSLALETALSLGVLVMVALLGTIAPPSAQ